MIVIASPGLKVPTEADPRKYITEEHPVEIEPTAYYLRRLADRELTEVVAAQENPTPKAGTASKPAKSSS